MLSIAQKVCLIILVLFELIVGFWFSSRLQISSPDIFIYFLIGLAFLIVSTVFIFWLFFIKRPKIYGNLLGGSYLIKLVLFSATAGVALEGMTLFGAPGSSLLCLSDWHLTRIVFFMLLSSPVVFWAMLFPWRERFCNFFESISADGWAKARRTIIRLLIVAAAGICAGIGSAVICYCIGEANVWPYLACSIILASSIALIVLEWKRILKEPEWGFLIIILSLGLLNVSTLPARTGVSWDDQIHFDQANAMSYVVDAQYTDDDRFEAEIPAKSDYLDELLSGIVSVDESRENSISYTVDSPDMSSYNTGLIITTNGTLDISGSSWVSFASVGRIPSAVGLWIGRFLHLPFELLFGFGRLANLLFYAVICFFALRKLKSGKLIVGAVLSLPLSVFLASNYSYDSWLLCLFAYSFCSYLKILQSPDMRISYRVALSVLIPGIFALMVKAVMFPLLLIFLMIPSSRFSDAFTRKRYSFLVLMSCLLLLISFVMPFLSSLLAGTASGDLRGRSGVNSGLQVSFLLHNPLSFFHVLIGYAADSFIPTVYFTSLTKLAYLYSGVPLVASLLLIFYFVALVFLDRSSCDFQYAFARNRIAAGILIIVVYVLIVLALYVSFTPVGATSVDGVQPRYFLPCLIPLLTVCCNPRMINGLRKDMLNATSVLFSFLFLLYCYYSSIFVLF